MPHADRSATVPAGGESLGDATGERLSGWDPRRAARASRGERCKYGALWFGFAVLCTIGIALLQGVVGIFFTAGYLVFQTVVLGQRRSDLSAIEDQLILLLFPIGTATTLVAALGVSLLFYGRRWRERIAWRGMNGTQWMLVVMLVLPLAVVASEVTNWAARYLPQFQLDQLMAFGESSLPLVLIAGCLLPGVGEEIFFRGFLSRGLLAWNGTVLGTLLASLLFGLVHVEPVQACGAFVLGLALQYLYLATGSLLAPVVLHTLNNALSFLAFRWREVYPVPGLSVEAERQGWLETPWYLLFPALLALGVLLSAFARTRTRWRLPGGEEWSPGYPTAESPPGESRAKPVSRNLPWTWILAVAVTWSAVLVGLSAAHRSLKPGPEKLPPVPQAAIYLPGCSAAGQP